MHHSKAVSLTRHAAAATASAEEKKLNNKKAKKKKHGHIRYLPSATLCVWLLGIRAFLSQKRVTVAPLNLRVL